jgi:hypothetical protein
MKKEKEKKKKRRDKSVCPLFSPLPKRSLFPPRCLYTKQLSEVSKGKIKKEMKKK